VPHGVACALMLPVALKVNSEVCADDLARLCHAIFGRSPTTSRHDAVDVLIREIENIRDRIGIPQKLSQLGVRREQIPALVKSSRGSSMSGNPRELSDDELTDILENIF
jgi:alcohol dehydrogenase class IV